jgi:Zn-dependent protease with chaperone function
MKLIDGFCGECKQNYNCEYLASLRRAVARVNEGVGRYYSWSIYFGTDDEYKLAHNYCSGENFITMTCGAVKKLSEEQIVQTLIDFTQSDLGSSNDNDIIESETTSHEEKIEKIKKALKIDNPINIFPSRVVNGFTDINNIINISSAALDDLDFNEIAFIIAHEKAHIDNNDSKKKSNIINAAQNTAKEILDSDQGLFSKLVDVAKVSAIGYASFVVQSQSAEIAADVQAKKMLREANLSTDGGEKLMRRFNNGFSFTHPSSNLRNAIIKKI